VKPEIDLPPETDHYSPEVYEKAKENFGRLVSEGIFKQDEKECLYVYSLTMNGKRQVGIVGCAGVDDYMNGIIKKHELTRKDKEEDRMNHVRVSDMNAEPVFFAIKDDPELKKITDKVIAGEAEYDFVSDDGVRHTFWVINDDDDIKSVTEIFSKIPYTYVADGHHRTAAAALVGNERKKLNPNHTGKEEYNYFLAVHFPASELTIWDYNRVVKDLNGNTPEEFLQKIAENFDVKEIENPHCKPARLHDIGLCMGNRWFLLTPKPGIFDENDPIDVLDVTILYKNILSTILGIKDLRTDKRIDFVGGIRGLDELKKRVLSGEAKAAFALYPVSMEQLMKIADSGLIMPPKTTWFEPKLRSGLIVHSIK
jgi:uncharacterized protein (DUF1015 family)